MRIHLERKNEINGSSFVSRDVWNIEVGEMDGKKVCCTIECESGYFDEKDFFISLDDISNFKARGRPTRFDSYHSRNFDDFCLIKRNRINWKRFINKRIKDIIKDLKEHILS